MLTARENDRLCRVENGAPMGAMLRRYWIPAVLSEEVEADGAPRRLRLLGERLVAFRDTLGRVGVVAEGCPHRGASLWLARNEECGLRCLYHGWKIGVDGTVLETPTEPEDSTFGERLRHVAYPTHEAGGMVWVYMGPPEHRPEFPAFEWTGLPDEQRIMIKIRHDCNWVQCLEGVIDSAHSNFLHSGYIRPAAVDAGSTVYRADGQVHRPSNDTRPRLEVQDTDYGFRYGALRRPIQDPENYVYVRTTLFVAPFHAFIPAPLGWGYMQSFVPEDDTHTAFYFIRYSLERPFEAAERERILAHAGVRPGVDIDADYNKLRTEANVWLQDRAAMAAGTTFSGISGVQNEDGAVQESMGPIVDRTREHLGTSDVAVIRMRRMMLRSLSEFEDGTPPVGLRVPVEHRRLHAEEKTVPREVSWLTVGAFAGEPVQ